MTRLDIQQVLNDYKTKDPLTITTLKLNQKALSDITGLSLFKNLEKLDLTFNNLTSLQGLESCTNLKWLSVVQNKLDSLKGIEGLSKLTVLNAGKNKLRSMDEIRPLVGLCALILNDNEIASICKLDQMKNLNTLGMVSRFHVHFYKLFVSRDLGMGIGFGILKPCLVEGFWLFPGQKLFPWH